MSIRQKGMVSIDVGSSALKIVKIRGNGKLRGSVSVEVPEEMARADRDEYIKFVANTLRKAGRKVGIRGGRCALVLSGPEVIIRRFTLPRLPPDAILINVSNEISSYLALSVENYNIDYKLTGVSKSPEGATLYSVLVAAIQKDTSADLLEAVRKAGFKPKYVDVAENVREKLIRSALERKHRFEYKDVAVLDIGHDHSCVSVFFDRQFLVSRYINIAGAAMTEQLTFVSHVDPVTATLRKTNYNYFEDAESEINRAVQRLFDGLVAEVSSVFDYVYYRDESRARHIEKVFLSGGSANLKGLPEYLTEQLGIPVVSINELLTRCVSRRRHVDLSQYSDAIGATLREVSR